MHISANFWNVFNQWLKTSFLQNVVNHPSTINTWISFLSFYSHYHTTCEFTICASYVERRIWMIWMIWKNLIFQDVLIWQVFLGSMNRKDSIIVRVPWSPIPEINNLNSLYCNNCSWSPIYHTLIDCDFWCMIVAHWPDWIWKTSYSSIALDMYG